ncbi:MAG: phosphoribosylglycinamide formyltransferase, partial [Leptonema sp. (in: Bacteria)]|nr:phosphoribosylglycinamide formyltransferase [Leptonema sp. (in: bacteria)]
MVRIVALASGRGSNFAAILAAVQSKTILNAEMVGLVVDRPSTGAQNHAEKSNIECTVVDYNNFQLKEDYHLAFAEAVESFQPDLIVAAGYMRILDTGLVRRYKNRILNIHPSLLPA